MSRPRATFRQTGFTLTELAVVLVIVALLIGGMLLPLAAQDELRRTQETQRTLSEIREALIGYVATNDRLPCPATAGSNGLADPAVPSACNATFGNGFIPAATLGIAPVDANGFAVDAWGNRIRYAVTTASGNAFTNSGVRGYYVANGIFPTADLRVCSSSAPIVANKCANPETSNVLTNTAVAVVFSVGKNGGDNGGADETINLGAGPIFVFHNPTPRESGNEFDDIVVWLSPNILFNRMIAAGRLP